MNALCRGEDAACRAFHARFEKLVNAIAWRFTKSNKADFEELAQDIWLHLWAQLCSGRWDESRGSLGGFVARTARNKAIDWARVKKRTPVGPSLDDLLDKGWVPVAQRYNPNSQAVTEAVRDCLDKMKPSCRDVLDLWLQDFSYKEIVEILKSTEGSVRSLISRCRQALIECLTAKGVTP